MAGHTAGDPLQCYGVICFSVILISKFGETSRMFVLNTVPPCAGSSVLFAGVTLNTAKDHKGTQKERKKERKKHLFAMNNNAIKQQNKETILKLTRSRLPEKQKAIYAGRLHC